MNDPITWQQIVGAVVIVSALAGMWFRIEAANREARDDAAAEIAQLRADLTDYKLVAADKFAHTTDISAVEIRVLGQVANVAVEVRYLRESIDKLLREMATQRGEA